MNRYKRIRLQEVFVGDNVPHVQEMLADFSCPFNSEVTDFLQNNAVEFGRKKMAVTHLLLTQDNELAGFFTLTHKVLKIEGDMFSKSKLRKLMRHARPDENNVFYVSAFLLAQVSKNFALPMEKRISGIHLMQEALLVLKDVQRDIGGEVVFLECEDRPQLLDFYCNEENRFFRFGRRQANDGIKYMQLMRFL